MKKRILYHIPTYGEGEVLKVISIERKLNGFVIELERKPLLSVQDTQRRVGE
jgi:hypothetical protein